MSHSTRPLLTAWHPTSLSGDSLRLQKVPEMGIWPLRDCVSAIQELKYSPDHRTLAVASHDQVHR